MLKVTLSKPRSPATELQLEGVVEELRRDKKMYQKTAMMQLRSDDGVYLYYISYYIIFFNTTAERRCYISRRQPFPTFPQSLLLRETFTVDLLKGLYILESKAGFHGNREVVHTLTLGYRPPSPFVSFAEVV